MKNATAIRPIEIRVSYGIHPHLDALKQTAGFYLNQRVYQAALRLADELKWDDIELAMRCILR